MPTLVLCMEKVLRDVEARGLVGGDKVKTAALLPVPAEGKLPYDPITRLAQYLMRSNPNEQAKAKRRFVGCGSRMAAAA